MSDEMSTFRVDLEIENPERPGARRKLQAVLVDTKSCLVNQPIWCCWDRDRWKA